MNGGLFYNLQAVVEVIVRSLIIIRTCINSTYMFKKLVNLCFLLFLLFTGGEKVPGSQLSNWLGPDEVFI